MSVLSDKDIKKYLKEKKVSVEPITEPDIQIQPAWIDLRLGDEFSFFKESTMTFIDTRKKYIGYTDTIKIEKDRPFIIHPGQFVLGCTKETVKLPDDIAGYIDGRSSLGRLGLVVHVTSGWVDPGWEGRLVLEMTNVGKLPIAVYSDMRICKLVLFKMSSKAEIPYSKRKEAKYKKQKTIDVSKIYQEFTKNK